MGVDVTLMIVPGNESPAPCIGAMRGDLINYAHNVLPLVRSSDMWEALEEIQKEHGEGAPDDLMTFLGRPPERGGESGYYQTTEDCYGNRLQHVPVTELLRLSSHPRVEGVPYNRAAWAYLDALPDDARVIIYWH